MRRIAHTLPASLLVLLTTSGCSLFQKKEAEVQMTDAASESYVQPAYEEPAGDYDPYAVDTSPAPQERSYPAAVSTDAAPAARYHVVSKGDTLYRLARHYYGNQARWKDLFEANRAEISDPNRIRVGQRLVIP